MSIKLLNAKVYAQDSLGSMYLTKWKKKTFCAELRISNNNGSVTVLKLWPKQTYVLEGGASNRV
jgi:hypothetical protein